MSDIPDGADAVVARMAIAWEMTKQIVGTGLAGRSSGERIKFLLATYNEVYEGVKGRVAEAKTR